MPPTPPEPSSSERPPEREAAADPGPMQRIHALQARLEQSWVAKFARRFIDYDILALAAAAGPLPSALPEEVPTPAVPEPVAGLTVLTLAVFVRARRRR